MQSTPWSNLEEFTYVYKHLFHHFNQQSLPSYLASIKLKFNTQSLLNLKHASSIISMWNSRSSKVPICVDSSQQLLSALYLMNDSNECQRRTIAMAIVRLVNRLTDPMSNQPTIYWSKLMSFPSLVF